MTEKRGRGRPKGSPNKPKMELITERRNLTQNADVYEILCQANIVAEEDSAKAVNGIRVFNDRNGAVKKVLQWLFDVNINSTLPEGETPFNRDTAPGPDLSPTQLRHEVRKFRYFVTEEVPVVRREAMWIQLLEGIPAKEAEMLDLVKDKKNPFPNITKEIAVEAFPDIRV
jgi:hypothetical protein